MKLRRPRAKKAFFLALPVICYLWPQVVFYPAGWILSRNDEPQKGADYVMLLMGEPHLRPAEAAHAVKTGFSDKLIFVKSESNPLEEAGLMPSEDTLAMAAITRTGLPKDQVTVLTDYGRATSTVDEAIAIARYFKSLDTRPKRIIVVTSWPHSARAGWILEKALTAENIKVELLPITHIPYDKSNWWQSERGLLFVFEEYIKWGRYLIKYLGRDII